MNFKERAENLAKDYDALDKDCIGKIVTGEDGYPDYLPYESERFEKGRVDLIESFAREIASQARQEALEEAAHAIVCTPKYPLSDHDAHKRALDRVLALKDPVTLAASGKDDK